MPQVDKYILTVDKTLSSRRIFPQRVGDRVSSLVNCDVREVKMVGENNPNERRVIARVLLAEQLCDDMENCSEGDCGDECESILLRRQLEGITFGRLDEHDLNLAFLHMELKNTPSRQWRQLALAKELRDRRYVWLTAVWKVISERRVDGDHQAILDHSLGMPEMTVVIADMMARHGIECWTEWSGIKDVDSKYRPPVFGQDGDIVFLYCVGDMPRGIGSELRRECLRLNTANWKGHKLHVALRELHLRQGKPDAVFAPIARNHGLDMNLSYNWLQMAYMPLRICEG